ncbi:MAG: hypothetical protein K2L64_01100, partial [Ureaplasma sp.]|nr:hypothetical protein [Ureaplasma sp.]
TINRSFSINKKLSNVTGNNNPYNENTIKNFQDLFDYHSTELSTENLQSIIINQIERDFALKKQEALINAKIIEVFAIPAIYSDISKYDNDKDGQFSLYDLLTNLGGPISEWYKLKGLNEAADIISNILSPKPIYKAFHGMFDSLMKLLRSMNSPIVSDILDFIEQSLTIDGKIKSEEQFKDFFVNIANLKEVVAPLLISGGSMSGYQVESILSLIDSLSNPNENILIWLSNNFSSILNLVGKLVQLPSAVGSIITGLGTINITYNGKQNCNILTDIPLYNLLSREGLSIKKYIGLINAALLLGDGIFNTIFNAIGLKETDIISSLGITLIKQLIRIVGGQATRRQIKASNWGEAFKSYWIPKEYNGVANTENKTIYDIINDEKDSYKFTYTWTPLDSNSESLPKYTLNHKLSLDFKLPNYKFTLLSSSGPLWTLKKTDTQISNIQYDYYFPNSSAIPTIRKVENQTFVDISIPTYVNTSGVSIAMALPAESFILNNITSELAEDKENKFSSYSTDVYNTNSILSLSKDKTPFSISLNSKTDLIDISNDASLSNYKILSESGYKKLITALNGYSINLNLDDITIRPSIYVQYVPATKNEPEKYNVCMKFPVNILVREYDSSNDQEIDSLKNLVTFSVEVIK